MNVPWQDATLPVEKAACLAVAGVDGYVCYFCGIDMQICNFVLSVIQF